MEYSHVHFKHSSSTIACNIKIYYHKTGDNNLFSTVFLCFLVSITWPEFAAHQSDSESHHHLRLCLCFLCTLCGFSGFFQNWIQLDKARKAPFHPCFAEVSCGKAKAMNMVWDRRWHRPAFEVHQLHQPKLQTVLVCDQDGLGFSPPMSKACCHIEIRPKTGLKILMI